MPKLASTSKFLPRNREIVRDLAETRRSRRFSLLSGNRFRHPDSFPVTDVRLAGNPFPHAPSAFIYQLFPPWFLNPQPASAGPL